MLPPESPQTSSSLARHSSRPDGDVELDALDLYDPFIVPTCDSCGEAMLRPRVVFHGGNVEVAVAANAKKRAEDCSGVLIVGSTLSTFSAYRLVRDISLKGRPVAILNRGSTRGDEHSTLRISEDIGEVLSKLVNELTMEKSNPRLQMPLTSEGKHINQ
jgi:NAD-dependent deacetylase sirtuin 4